MSLYLLDVNVLQEIRPGGNANVLAWVATVPDDQLRVSMITFFEMRRGWQSERSKRLTKRLDVADIDAKLVQIGDLEAAYGDRVINLDTAIGAELAPLVGQKLNNLADATLAATAKVYDMIVVTRNVKDFRGHGIDVLDPFVSIPVVQSV